MDIPEPGAAKVTMADEDTPVSISVGAETLTGDLGVPAGAAGIVLFAHGSGSSRHSPRNRLVAGVLRAAGLATLLTDLLTPEEEVVDAQTRHLRFNIPLLAERLIGITDWITGHPDVGHLAIGGFGASTGAAAALVAAAQRPAAVRAVVSRGGRPDLAWSSLPHVRAPTLLIVGANDVPVLDLNRKALARLPGEKEMAVIPGASHLFEEPGTLEQVARLAAGWFTRHLPRTRGEAVSG